MAKKTYRFPADKDAVQQGFQKHFGLNPSGYIDNLLSILFKKFILNIAKFDDFLHEKHGNYDQGANPISMKTLLGKEYGSEVSEFIESLLP